MIHRITQFFNGLKINARINLFIITLLIVVFTSLGFYIYITQRQVIFDKANSQLVVLMEDLYNLFEVQTNLKQQNVNSSMKFAYSFLKLQNLHEGDSIKNYFVTNQYADKKGIADIKTDVNRKNELDYKIQEGKLNTTTQNIKNTETIQRGSSIEKIELNNLYLNGLELHENYDFVNFIKQNGVEMVSILQDDPKLGFVRISTTLMHKTGFPAVNTYIPKDSDVVRIVKSTGSFQGRSYELNDWYLTYYQAIKDKSDKKIIAILAVGVRQTDFRILKPLFYKKKYFLSGYPFVVSGDGFSVINVSGIEGKDLNKTTFFKKLVDPKNKLKETFDYKWPETEDGDKKIAYFKYFEPLDIYVATSIYEYELYSGIEKTLIVIIIGVFISIIIFYIGIAFIFRPVTSSIQNLVETISVLSTGRLVDNIFYHRRDEIGDIVDSLNKLIGGLGATARFANEIERGNFNSEFIPLSKDDILGNSLLDMRRSLKTAKEQEERTRTEEEKRNWATEGLANFADILHQHSENMEDLGDNLIKNLVKYLSANQAGLYVFNDDDASYLHFNLVSAFAYNRKKFITKHILPHEGLIGACAMEKASVYLTDIPHDYLEIESGLGKASPTALLLVPLQLESKILGVIEIASFNEFKEFEIKFIEKLAENIASTISIAKINAKTGRLLQESQMQARELAAQEEEMRQNLEELQATQEESARRQAEMSGVVSALDTSFLIAEMDMEGRVIKMNDSFIRIMDSPFEKLFGKRHLDIIHVDPTQYNEYSRIWDELKLGNSGQKIQSYHKNNAGEFWLSETYTIIQDNVGNPYKILNIAVDISESKIQEIEIQNLLKDAKKREKKLEAQERLNHFNVEKLAKMQAESVKKEAELTAILNAIDSTVIRGEYTIEGIVLSVNNKYISTMEYTLEEIVDKNIRLFVPQEEAEKFETIWQSVCKGNSFDGISKRTTKTGKEIWLLMSYTPVIDKSKNIYKILFLASEITKQVISENKARERAQKMLMEKRQMSHTIDRMASLESELQILKINHEAISKALNLSSFIITLDINAKIINVSDTIIANTGKQKNEFVGLKCTDYDGVISFEEEQKFEAMWNEVSKGESFNRLHLKYIGDSLQYISDTFTPVKDENNELQKVIWISTDITNTIQVSIKDELLQMSQEKDGVYFRYLKI